MESLGGKMKIVWEREPASDGIRECIIIVVIIYCCCTILIYFVKKGNSGQNLASLLSTHYTLRSH